MMEVSTSPNRCCDFAEQFPGGVCHIKNSGLAKARRRDPESYGSTSSLDGTYDLDLSHLSLKMQ